MVEISIFQIYKAFGTTASGEIAKKKKVPTFLHSMKRWAFLPFLDHIHKRLFWSSPKEIKGKQRLLKEQAYMLLAFMPYFFKPSSYCYIKFSNDIYSHYPLPTTFFFKSQESHLGALGHDISAFYNNSTLVFISNYLWVRLSEARKMT